MSPNFTPLNWAPRGLFTTALGLSHLSASLSWSAQAASLIGSEGLSPLAARVSSGATALSWPQLSLLSWSQSDAWLYTVGALWVLSALALSAQRLPRLSLALCLSCALSISQAASPFLPFQWDILLHEASLLGLFYVTSSAHGLASEPWTRARWLGAWGLRLLLFKLVWDSGLAKLLGGDELWSSLKALYVHFWTQPLPHQGAALAAQLPELILRSGAYFTLAVELWVPFLFFARVRHPLPLWALLIGLSLIGGVTGRGPTLIGVDSALYFGLALLLDERLMARWISASGAQSWWLGPRLNQAWAPAAPIALLMLLISATGSYGFFQVLTLSLCVPLFDRPPPELRLSWAPSAYLSALALSLWICVSVALHAPWLPRSLTSSEGGRAAQRWLSRELIPLQLIGRYGLFARMTRSRAELIVEGSDDAQRWWRYELPYQPRGEPTAPPMAGLHMPRLDWMFWFEALAPSCREGWLLELLEGLFEGRETLTQRLSPGEGAHPPPRYLRVRRLSYRPSAHSFWSAHEAGTFCPIMTHSALKRARAQHRASPKLPSATRER